MNVEIAVGNVCIKAPVDKAPGVNSVKEMVVFCFDEMTKFLEKNQDAIKAIGQIPTDEDKEG